MKTEMANRIKIAAKVAMALLKIQLQHRETTPDENKKTPLDLFEGRFNFSLRMAFLKKVPSVEAGCFAETQ
jgi:hypothetical protein